MFIVEFKHEGVCVDYDLHRQMFIDREQAELAVNACVSQCLHQGISVIGQHWLADGVELELDNDFSISFFRYYPSTMIH